MINFNTHYIRYPLTLILLLYHLGGIGQNINSLHYNYTINDGLPSDMLYGIIQDNDGFIWVGSDAGLTRFDGYDFRNYGLEEGLPDIEILDMYEDINGVIWLHTLNGKLAYLKNDTIFNTFNDNELINGNSRIVGIEEDNSNKLWVSWEEGKIAVYDHNKLDTVYTMNRHIGDMKIFDGKVYFLSGPSSNLCFNGTEFIEYPKPLLKKSPNASSRFNILMEKLIITCSRNDIIENKIIEYQDSITYEYVIKKYEFGEIYNSKVIRDSMLFVFSENGIFRLDKSINTSKKILNLGTREVDLVIDKDDGYWVSSLNSGLYYFPKTELNSLHSGNSAYAVNLGDPGKMHISLSDKLIVVNNEFETHEITNIKQVASANFIHRDQNKNLWVGYDIGLFRNNKKIAFGSFRYLREYDNHLYFITHLGLFIVPINDKEYTFKSDSKYKQVDLKNATALHMISKDSILIGSYQGLYLYNNTNELSKLSSYNKLFGSSIVDIVERDNNTFLAAQGKGLLSFEKNDFHEVTQYNQLTSNICTSLYLQDSIFWVGTKNGLNRLEIDDELNHILYMTKEDGLLSNTINNITEFNNNIIISTPKGINYFPSNAVIKILEQGPSLYINSINGSTVAYNIWSKNELAFNPTERNMKIEYVALDYRYTSSMQYEFAFSEDTISVDWNSTKERSVNILNSNNGDYYFLLRARNQNSDWSTPLVLSIHFEAHFYETTWFKLIIIGLLTLIIYLIISSIYRSKNKRLSLQANVINSELKALRAQLNPHFVSNVLSNIQNFILNNNNAAADIYLNKFFRLMRHILNHSEQSLISIDEEEKMLRLYVELEQLRLSNSFNFEFNIDTQINPQTVKIPAMILQPLVENSIWHGLSQIDHEGELLVSVEQSEQYIEISVKDNGRGFSKQKKNGHKSMGLKLVNERLALFNKGNNSTASLEYLPPVSDETGTTILIRWSLN